MKAILLCLLLSSSAWSLTERELLTLDAAIVPPMEAQRLNDVRSAIGLLVEDKGDKHFHSLTGFFYEPRLFLTTRAPDTTVLPECEKLKIHVGVTSADRTDIAAQKVFTCEKVVQSNAQYGFIVIRTKERNELYLPLGSEEVTRQITTKPLAAVGYSADAFPFLSVGCEAKPGFCTFCSRSKEFPINTQVWGEADCLYTKGMAGSPLVFWKDEGRVAAVGMIGPISSGASGTNLIQNKISVIRFPAIQLRFGADLTGKITKRE